MFLLHIFKGNMWGSFVLSALRLLHNSWVWSTPLKKALVWCAGVGWLLHGAHPKWVLTFQPIFTSSLELTLFLYFLSHTHFKNFEFISANHHPSGQLLLIHSIFNWGTGLLLPWFVFVVNSSVVVGEIRYFMIWNRHFRRHFF